MNKNAIQKYAIWARNELIEQVKQRAYQYGISDKGYGDENAAVISGRVLSADEKRQRTAFIHEIQKHGYQEAVEEVAYTWFNRFVALRFMEVNDYLPTHVRVFSDATGGFNPEILKDVLHLDLEGLDKAKVSELLNANQTEELYRYLLLTQCNALNAALPEMFEKLGSYTEMLLPNNILKPDGVLGRLVTDISEGDWRDAVQIIGWMYQYYNTEPKQIVDAKVKKGLKVTKDELPAKTQLFTPDWIVRYMVENSLGRLWLESHPNPTLKANWKYYLDEAEQTPEVAECLRVLRTENVVKSPEDIKVIDPCMGSGHILVYAFDVLMQIYESVGESPRDAVKLILERNLYGLDIDRRAYQLAYFALMMKARQYNRRIFTENIKPQVYHPAGFPDGEEYGSLVRVDKLEPMPEQLTEQQMTLFDGTYDAKLNTWNFRRLLAQKYDVVVTNPPYMGGSGMAVKLSEFVKNNYPDSKSDLFAVFIERGLELIKPIGYNCMVTMQSWMFLSSFETMRKKILSNSTISTLMHMENMVMGIAFGTAVSNLYSKHIDGYKGFYNHVKISDIEDDKPVTFPPVSKCNTTTTADNFAKITGCPVAYWATKPHLNSFINGTKLIDLAEVRDGFTTGDNNLFLRLWYEVNFNKTKLNATSHEEALHSNAKWFPYNKGGEFRKWYGNNSYLINWENNGLQLKQFSNSVLRNQSYAFAKGITWTLLSNGGHFGARISEGNSLFDTNGKSMFPKQSDIFYILGFILSKVSKDFLKILNPTMAFQVGDLCRVPIVFDVENRVRIESLSKDCIAYSVDEWNSFETSWDFNGHPLISGERTVAAEFAKWENEATDRFDTLKANEEELNRIFIDIYGLSEELTPEVEYKDVTVRRADLGREIRSLISYALGCMFGRYSMDTEGLAYAGGDWDTGKYHSFIPDKDNILPICDDEYFDDDILGRFVDFVRVVYGAETLEENLKFIADSLGGKGTPREVIRNYFLNDFYADHCKIYQKRPIYWLFDSGKKNGFKALIYLHRYSRDLLAKLRTDYVHEQQERYRTQLSHITAALNTATGSERARLLKQQDKLTEQFKEITVFEEKVHHLADQNIEIDLDDGVKKNYEIFTEVLAKI